MIIAFCVFFFFQMVQTRCTSAIPIDITCKRSEGNRRSKEPSSKAFCLDQWSWMEPDGLENESKWVPFCCLLHQYVGYGTDDLAVDRPEWVLLFRWIVAGHNLLCGGDAMKKLESRSFSKLTWVMFNGVPGTHVYESFLNFTCGVFTLVGPIWATNTKYTRI